MTQELVIKSLGLVTNPNPADVPPGGMATCTNWVVERDGLLQPRRGVARKGYVGGAPHQTHVFQSALVTNYGTQASASSLRYSSDASTWNSVTGTFTNSAALRMKSATSRGTLFFTTSEGVRRWDNTSNAPIYAGGVKATSIDRTGPGSVLTGTGGFLQDGYQVAYRVAWVLKDANGNVLTGSPSSRTVIANTTGTSGYSGGVARNVVARVLLPKQNGTTATALTTSYYFQLYRSKAVAVGTQPSDELQLVYEAYLAAGDISAGYVDVTDSTTEALLGPFLYTNPNTGDLGGPPGIYQANEPPPLAYDVELFRDCLFFARTQTRQRLKLTVLSVVASTGLTAGDTLTIAGVTYTAVSSGPTGDQFVVLTSGTASYNIEQTALNLVECINRSSSNSSIWATYVSGPNDLPGAILLEHRQPAGSSFTAAASAHGTAYRPQIASAQSSANDSWDNGLYWSKPLQPDAVPLLNFTRVGPSDAVIDRIKAVGDSLFVFTTAGLYRLTGTYESGWDVELWDASFRLVGREYVVACPSETSESELYAWGRSGVVAISATSIRPVSGPIDSTLRAAIGTATFQVLADQGHAWSYPPARKVGFGVFQNSTDKAPDGWYVYDTASRVWTFWQFDPNELRSTCAYFPTNDKLYWSEFEPSGDSYFFEERKALSASDFRDQNGDGVTAGISKTATWAVATAGNPAAAKQWQTATLLWGDTVPATASVQFSSEIAGAQTAVSLAPAGKETRTLVNLEAQRCARLSVTLTHSTDAEGCDVAGLALELRGYGSKVVR